MKAIKLCGECADYDKKMHRCRRGASREDDPRNTFFDDCPLPDAVPVVHSEWINRSGGNATCKRCGVRQFAVYDDDGEQNFCGHCGAMMDGKNHESVRLL